MRSDLSLKFFVVSAFVAGSLAGFLGSTLVKTKRNDASELREERDALSARLHEEEIRKERLESELAQIAKVDFADYQRLQNEEAQFMKAKEILGKVFLVLFHNVLSSVDDEQKKFVMSLTTGQSIDTVAEKPAAESPTAAPAAPTLSGNSPIKTPAPVSSAWTQAEKELGSLSPEKAEALLQSMVIKDILSEQGSSQSFRDDDTRLQAMQGFYSGDITFLDPKRKPWTLEIDLSSEVRNGQQKGNLVVRIVDDEGRQSRLGEDGNIDGIMKPVSESKALLVKVYKTQFLQIYILEKQGIIIGNFYDERPDGKVEHLGRFKLRR